MAARKSCYTKHDAAIALRDAMERIMLRTTDPVVYALANEGSDLALSAMDHLGRASDYDGATGGGSGKAWSHRSKAARFMTKARKVSERIEQRGESLADYGMPSIDRMLFLRKVADSNGSIVALMIDHDRASPCKDARWLELRDAVGGPFWDLTVDGRDALEKYGSMADALADAA